MGLLISYVLGAASAAVLILVVLRRHGSGDAGIGELRGLLDGVSRQQEHLMTQASQWNQLLGHPGRRGRWGEVTLQNLIEAAGLREHVDFDVQKQVSDGDQSRRPDLVLRLPTGGRIPIDSKTIWDAFNDSLSVEQPAAREELMTKHAASVRSCVKTLAQKAYSSQFARAPEMVVLFMPSEAAFAAAAAHDPKLLEYAIRQKVVITTPSTLFALLQVVAVGWYQADLSKNADRISKLGSQLVKRLADATSQLTKASKGLESMIRAHNELVAYIEGKVLHTAREMGALGVAGAVDLEEPSPVTISVREPQTHNLSH